MNTTLIKDVSKYEGQEVTIQGWIYNKRSSGKIHFLIIRDGSGLMQAVVVKSEVSEEVFESAGKITQESSAYFTGKVRKEPRSQGGYELSVTNIKIIQLAVDYPISPKEHGTDFLMDNRHLWLRSSRQFNILRVRSELIKACRDYMDDNGFTLIDTPILTPSACEGTTTLFETNYFDEKAYLSQSGQLYNEAAAMAFGKVYCFGPTFRAEKSKTRRHLIEFWMIEPEMAFCDLNGDMDVIEDFISYIVKRVVEKKETELISLGRNLDMLKKVEAPFPRVSYDEAVEILKAEGADFKWGGDFGGGDETIIANKFEKPVFIHRFPSTCKAFYMKRDQERDDVCLSTDLLAPEGYGEIVGAGQREEDIDVLLSRIKEHNLPEEAYKWYLDLRRYGSVPHAGFGMGIERTLSWICGLEHVRETIAFPRMLTRLYP